MNLPASEEIRNPPDGPVGARGGISCRMPSQRGRKTKAPGPAVNHVGRTVLLVDDDGDFRLVLAEALRDDGHQVIEARSGEAALAVLDHVARTAARPPDLVVLDLLMPRMSGIEVLQRLRKSQRWARLPVLVVTAVNDPMLPVRLDVPVAFKPDAGVVLETINRQLASDDGGLPRARPARSLAPVGSVHEVREAATGA